MMDSSGVRQNLIAGTVSGVLTRTFIEPLDVLKIRFQLQVEPIKQARVVSGLVHGYGSAFALA